MSLSLSNVVGQKASLPNLLVSLFTGAPTLSTAFHAWSKPFFEPVRTRSHHVDCDMMRETLFTPPVPAGIVVGTGFRYDAVTDTWRNETLADVPDNLHSVLSRVLTLFW